MGRLLACSGRTDSREMRAEQGTAPRSASKKKRRGDWDSVLAFPRSLSVFPSFRLELAKQLFTTMARFTNFKISQPGPPVICSHFLIRVPTAHIGRNFQSLGSYCLLTFICSSHCRISQTGAKNQSQCVLKQGIQHHKQYQSSVFKINQAFI